MDTHSDENSIIVHAHIDTSDMDEATKKALTLKELLEEASSLVDELASKEIKLSVEIES